MEQSELRFKTKQALSEICKFEVDDQHMIMQLYSVCAQIFAYPNLFEEHQTTLRDAYRHLCEKGYL